MELKEGGADIPLIEENKEEYVRLYSARKLYGGIESQLDTFLQGFREVLFAASLYIVC